MLFENLFAPRSRPRRRGYAAAAFNRLTSDWAISIISADAEARRSLRTLRARSRELWMNNDYMLKFLGLLKNNVIGPVGIFPQMHIINAPPTKGDPKPERDKFAEGVIEREFRKWAKKENCSASGDMSFYDMQRLLMETVPRDGEVIVQKLRNFDNPYGFALHFLEADHLDETHNAQFPDGRQIRMGVEIDKWGRPLFYHLADQHPGDFLVGGRQMRKHTPTPAEEICHVFIRTRPGQTRGIPWAHTAMTRMRMMGASEEAQLVATRIASSKMGFFTEKEGDYGGGAGAGTNEDDEWKPMTEVEPGILERLPPGVGFESADWEYPTGTFEPFLKSMLHGVAAGLGVSFMSLTTDLTNASFSSGRIGLLEERDFYRALQNFVIEHFLQDVFADWLTMAIMTGRVPLPAAKFDKFNSAKWQKRGWQWVDPLKDSKSNIEEIGQGLNTRRDVCGSKGLDWEETFEQLAAEKELADALGLTFGAKEAPAAPAADMPDEDEMIDDDKGKDKEEEK